jgi:hypothetical protein
MRLRTLALVGAIAASTVLVAPASATDAPAPAPAYRNSCNPRVAALPAAVEGKPTTFKAGAEKALYVWHTKQGWRVRLTHGQKLEGSDKGARIVVQGRITASRPVSNIRRVKLEANQSGEWVRIVKGSARRSVDFRFVNYGYIDGLDFTAGCAGRLGITVWEVTKRDGQTVRMPVKVIVGKDNTTVTELTRPALLVPPSAPTYGSRVVILRAPVPAITPAP